MTECLRASANVDVGGGRVARVEVQDFAEGLGVLGRLCRLALTWADAGVEGDASGDARARAERPSSLVAKFESASPPNREVARAMRLYQRELAFYANAADRTPLRVPRVYAQQIDAGTQAFVLLMEDLGHVAMGDQVVGATPAQLAAIVPVLAQHHASFWGAELGWTVGFDDPALAKVIEGIYQAAVEPALDKFADAFSPRMQRAARALVGRVGEQWTRLSTQSPRTLVHGDFRLDNIGFDEENGGRVVGFDWQVSGANVGTYDLGFLMSQSVAPEVRGPLDREIVRLYHDTLVRFGIANYGFEQCFEDYRRTVMVCLIYPVIVCGMFEMTTERARTYARGSLERSLSAIEALSADALLS